MDRSRLGRGLAILAVAALAVAVVSPAFSAAPLTKAKVKKIAKKQVKKVGPGLFIEEDELDRFPVVTVNTGAADQILFTKGPFTAIARCNLDGGDVRGQVYIQTSEGGSLFHSYDQDEETPFDPADGLVLWYEHTGNPPGGAPDGDDSEHDSGASAYAPSGVTFSAIVRVLTNYGGSHCRFDGWLLDLTP
jgi:hypothetical protein